ncbi:MAG TPA: phenylalanine--tRNA ligase subunit beta [Candidatus Thermoplasmatota archaeon]|nr:phenylalanine--tRNA ligase subunit beta [Candidatus Thermoplasmatota archaeon]
MPVVKFPIKELERLLGTPVPRERLARDIPMIGADVEDAKGDTWAVEFFPDRPDLFTVEGIARALRSWYGFETGLRRYDARPSGTHVAVDPSVEKVRPFIQCAFVRGVDVTEERLQQLIDLQEDLHWGLGARRRRVAIGVHDAAPLAPPFTYGTWGLDEGRFVPLAHADEMTPREVLAKHPKGVEYAHLLAGEPRVPIILDAKGGVLSLPPVINAARTTVTTRTRDLFLDVTGTDEWAVGRALNILATSLAEGGGRLESVEVRRGGRVEATPRLEPEERALDVEESNRLLGMRFTAEETAERLRRMGHGAQADGARVKVQVPPYRADVLHAWDLVEDVAIGHGLANFEPEPLHHPTVGAQLPESRVSERARRSLVGLGFLETMSLTLTNARDQFERMQRPPTAVVEVKNPVTEDHTMLRPSLLPGLLHVLKRNAHRDLPQRIFEVGVVTHLKDGAPVFERRVAAVHAAGRSSFSEVKGVALALARDLGWGEPAVGKVDDPAFVRGRCAGLTTGGLPRGVFGEVSPAVLEAFGIGHPVVAFELHLARGPGDHVRGANG